MKICTMFIDWMIQYYTEAQTPQNAPKTWGNSNQNFNMGVGDKLENLITTQNMIYIWEQTARITRHSQVEYKRTCWLGKNYYKATVIKITYWCRNRENDWWSQKHTHT